MKPISPRIHALLDYLSVLVFALAPMMFNLTDIPSKLAYGLAIGYFLFTLLTEHPGGLLRIVPFPVHVMMEYPTALFLIASPWLFGFSDQSTATTFFIAAGVVTLVVASLTRTRTAELPHGHAV